MLDRVEGMLYHITHFEETDVAVEKSRDCDFVGCIEHARCASAFGERIIGELQVSESLEIGLFK